MCRFYFNDKLNTIFELPIYYFCVSMNQIVKTSFAWLLLALFMFPQVQKGMHDFEHRHDTHCDAKAEQHLHPLEHVCSICDFSVPVSTEFLTFYFSKLITVCEVIHQIPVDDCIVSDFKYQLPPRAPPVFFS